ncbi:MAG: hypothetical protein WBA54_09000, partial [Acidaminobacteraceae bacterium]
NIIKCKKDRIALFNGFDSFEAFVESDEFRRETILRLKYDKLRELDLEELTSSARVDMDLESKDLGEIVDDQVEEMYKKYKNKNRY